MGGLRGRARVVGRAGVGGWRAGWGVARVVRVLPWELAGGLGVGPGAAVREVVGVYEGWG